MNLFYISCHSILEYDELKLFHEIGINVFSAGAYSNPNGHPTLPRPGLPQLTHYPDLEKAASYIRTNNNIIPQEIIDWADVIMFMHEPEMLYKNWGKIKHKKVIFRSIGQCVPHQEKLLSELRQDGLLIIRYAETEKNLQNFAGQDALIRFYKDPFEFTGWNGNKNRVINFTQSLKERRNFCHYDEIMGAMDGLDAVIYGNSNENLGDISGGELSYDDMKREMRDNRVYLYGGTWPAPYTLSFIEAWMTGIPVVAISKRLAQPPIHQPLKFYEVEDLIDHGVSGFVGDSIEQLREYIVLLMNDHDSALEIGKKGRLAATKLFGHAAIREQWRKFLV